MSSKILLQAIVMEAGRVPPFETYVDRIDMYIVSATKEDLEMLEDANYKSPDCDEVPVRRLMHLLGRTPFYNDREEFEVFKCSDYVLDGEIEAVENLEIGAWRKYRIEDNNIKEAEKVFTFIFN